VAWAFYSEKTWIDPCSPLARAFNVVHTTKAGLAMNPNSKKDIFKKKRYYRRLWKQTKIGEPSRDRLTTLRELARDISAFSKSSSLILEVGCGSGTVLRMLESKGHKNLIGIELVNTFLRGQNTSFIVAETMHLPFRPDSLDIIIARRFVSISDVRKSLEEFYNILKNDGKLVIDVSNVKSLKSRVNNLLGLPAYPEKYYP
jgi:SAM-dependent methyltransferase